MKPERTVEATVKLKFGVDRDLKPNELDRIYVSWMLSEDPNLYLLGSKMSEQSEKLSTKVWEHRTVGSEFENEASRALSDTLKPSSVSLCYYFAGLSVKGFEGQSIRYNFDLDYWEYNNSDCYTEETWMYVPLSYQVKLDEVAYLFKMRLMPEENWWVVKGIIKSDNPAWYKQGKSLLRSEYMHYNQS